jgi:hypothetical protein
MEIRLVTELAGGFWFLVPLWPEDLAYAKNVHSSLAFWLRRR